MADIRASQYWSLVYTTVYTIHAGALETISIDGVYGSFTTNTDGTVNHALPLGELTLTGSVSEQSFVRNVTKDTSDVYVMPAGALYWYGNEITELDLTNYKRNISYTKQSHSERKTNSIYDIGVTSTAHESAFGTNEMIDVSNFLNVYIAYKYSNSSIETNSMDISNLLSVYVCVTHCLTTNPREQFIIYALTKKTVTSTDEILSSKALYDVSSNNCNPFETYALWLE